MACMRVIYLGAVALAVGLGCSSRDRTIAGGVPPSAGGGTGTSTGTHEGGEGTTTTSGSSSSAGGGEPGVIVDPQAPCDSGLGISGDDPVKAAAAAGLCKQAKSKSDWGLVSARWALVDGSDPPKVKGYDVGHGILKDFGPKVGPREGVRLLALSSGTARAPGDPEYSSPEGYEKKYGPNDLPAGLVVESPSCPGVKSGAVFDDVALELTARAPAEATGLAFDFDFYTFEWPEYVCSPFNDYFLALLDPAPTGAPDGNISFDLSQNPMSVNAAIVRVCDCSPKPPCEAPPANPQKLFDCDLGAAELKSTGFEQHAASSWLVTKAPVTGGETITLRWGIYDAGDEILDSTVLIDNFRWLGEPVDDPTTNPLDPK